MEQPMFTKAVALGVATLLGAVPALAQETGRIEIGAFGSHAFFDRRLTLNTGDGAGAHLGYYVTPKWALEFDGSGLTSSRTLGLPDANVRRLAAGFTFTSAVRHRVSFLWGIGAADTKAPTFHDAGFNSLLGAKVRFSPSTSLRIDRGWTYMMGEKRSYGSWGAGLVIARRGHRTVDNTVDATFYPPAAEIMVTPVPNVVITTVTPDPVTVVTTVLPAPDITPRPIDPNDLEAVEALRISDSTAAANLPAPEPVVVAVTVAEPAPMSSAAALAIMTERVRFAYDMSI